jgi:hypothetical protein
LPSDHRTASAASTEHSSAASAEHNCRAQKCGICRAAGRPSTSPGRARLRAPATPSGSRASAMGTPLVQLSHPARLRGAGKAASHKKLAVSVLDIVVPKVNAFRMHVSRPTERACPGVCPQSDLSAGVLGCMQNPRCFKNAQKFPGRRSQRPSPDQSYSRPHQHPPTLYQQPPKP